MSDRGWEAEAGSDADAPGVEVHNVHPARTFDEAAVRALVERIVAAEGFVVRDLNVVLTEHSVVHELNREWLGHDWETDVVSFPLDDHAAAAKEVNGEVYVDLDTAAERAPEFGATFEHEALRYVAHGVLHLLGYADATDEGRARMRALEDRYLGGDA